MSQLIRLWQSVAPGAAFEACLRPQLERLWRLALRLQGNPGDAEDLMQELLERAWRHRKQVLSLDAPGPWLARVLYRLHVDRWRRRGPLADSASLDDPDSKQPPALIESGQALLTAVETAAVLRAVESLPEPQRAVLLLHDGEGYTLEEIGSIVEAPLGTVKSRLHRARAGVRQRIGDGTKTDDCACLASVGTQG